MIPDSVAIIKMKVDCISQNNLERGGMSDEEFPHQVTTCKKNPVEEMT
jgi:hypothetical protein